MNGRLSTYAAELRLELGNILDYWTQHTVDEIHGGFVGRITGENQVELRADKGAVLNARILWAFSAAFNAKATEDLSLADRAYHYMADHFIDKDFGGVYWSVDHLGKPKDTKKQIYAVAFTIYALTEYFMASGLELAKEHAVALYHDLVKYSHDRENGGYDEAFNREWVVLDDLRLSHKDANERKTMNTHLHILEAYTNLYRVWPDEDLKVLLQELIHDFKWCILDPQTKHLGLFFDEFWVRKSSLVSYGHDIEASWLLQEAAEVTADRALINEIKEIAVQLAEAALEGIGGDGALWYEREPDRQQLTKEKHWWVQAEAMIGFFNAWEQTGAERFLTASLNTWDYVKVQLLDDVHGEWFWGRDELGAIMAGEDKVGMWKCPYHNSRACIELLRRIDLKNIDD
ncbi:mannobiose 2-epimerase [Pedobacter sp. CAN_A7]|uniref:AGE family epimerase/isomerase n=1 Tax=Pedobacter sp. CAN_A7 TaxID=2787722 RepID=UPI001A28C662